MRERFSIGLRGLVVSVGVAFSLGYLTSQLFNFPWAGSGNDDKVKIQPEDAKIDENQLDIVFEKDGKRVFLPDFFAIFRNNPNKFSKVSEKSKFYIEGRIQIIRAWDDSIDKISGFLVPLLVPVNAGIDFERSQVVWPESVTVSVIGMSKSDVAELNVGDKIKVDCPKVRAFNAELVFDDCVIKKPNNFLNCDDWKDATND